MQCNLNFEFLEKELENYHDREIILLLLYGCPLSYESPGNLLRNCRNHNGATDFPEHIDKYLEEMAAGAVMGSFKESPFDVETVVSPLNTVAKHDSDEQRFIVDLSYPKHCPGQSVNVDCLTLLLARHLADVSCFIGPSMPSAIGMEIHTKIVQKRKKKPSHNEGTPRQPHVYF